MFTLTTNLAIWMAAVVDESVHQAHSYSGSYGNSSHTRLTPDRKFPVSTGPVTARHWMGAWRIHSQSTMPLPGHGGKGRSQSLLLLQTLPVCGWRQKGTRVYKVFAHP